MNSKKESSKLNKVDISKIVGSLLISYLFLIYISYENKEEIAFIVGLIVGTTLLASALNVRWVVMPMVHDQREGQMVLTDDLGTFHEDLLEELGNHLWVEPRSASYAHHTWQLHLHGRRHHPLAHAMVACHMVSCPLSGHVST